MTTDTRQNSERRGILAIGNLIVDKTHHIDRYPAESMLETIRSSASSPGGGAINVLFDLARVDPGLSLSIAGLTGNDDEARFLAGEFARHNVDARLVGRVADQPTSFTHVMISASNATRTFFHSHGANSRLDLDFIRKIDGTARIVHLAYLLLLHGLERLNTRYGCDGAEALAILQQKGFRTSLDLVSDSNPGRYRQFVLPALKYVDYLIINDVEAANLTETRSATEDGKVDWDAALAQAERLLGLGGSALVIIHFPEGAVAATRDGQRLRQKSYLVPKDKVVSALGAGDAFCAGVLYGLHENYDLATCLKLGSALARFNLFAASATDGAVGLADLKAFICAAEAAR